MNLFLAAAAAARIVSGQPADGPPMVTPPPPLVIEAGPQTGRLWREAELACVFNRFSEADRARMLSASPFQAGPILKGALLAPGFLDQAVDACKVPKERPDENGGHLAAYSLLQISLSWLSAHEHVSAARLDAAWAALPAQDRAAFAQASRAKDGPGIRRGIGLVAARLGLTAPSDDALFSLYNYMDWRLVEPTLPR